MTSLQLSILVSIEFTSLRKVARKVLSVDEKGPKLEHMNFKVVCQKT